MYRSFELGLEDHILTSLLNDPDTNLIGYEVKTTVGEDIFSTAIVEFTHEKDANTLAKEGKRKIEVFYNALEFNEVYNDERYDIIRTDYTSSKGVTVYLIDYLIPLE